MITKDEIKTYEKVNERMYHVAHLIFKKAHHNEYVESCRLSGDEVEVRISGVACGHGYSDEFSYPVAWLHLEDDVVCALYNAKIESESAAAKAAAELAAKKRQDEEVKSLLSKLDDPEILAAVQAKINQEKSQ